MIKQTAFPEDELARRAGAINSLSKGVMAALGLGQLIILIMWLLNPNFPALTQSLIIWITILIALASYLLNRAGKVEAAGYVMVIGLLAESAITTPLLGGFSGPAAITYFFPILAAGIVGKAYAGFYAAVLALILYVAGGLAERAGLIPQIMTPEEQAAVLPNLTVGIGSVFFFLVAFLSWFASSRLNQALHKVHAYAGELQVSNEKLQASEEELRASNEELEASNEELRATEEELRASNEELAAANEELKEAQEQLVRTEKLAAIGQLAGGVGHELRNPLGAIKNAVYYVRGKIEKSELAQKEPRVMEFLGIVDEEISSSNKIINDLLNFSRVGKPATSPARIEKVINDAIAHTVVPENIELRKELSDGLPDVEIDSDLIRQVLINMLTNAVQAMPGGGRLSVGARKNDGFMEVQIRDTGVGIKPENMRRLFDPLYTTKAKGIGLGLAVCKSIVDRHQGRIEVTSEAGEGTTFIVKLPLNPKPVPVEVKNG